MNVTRTERLALNAFLTTPPSDHPKAIEIRPLRGRMVTVEVRTATGSDRLQGKLLSVGPVTCTVFVEATLKPWLIRYENLITINT